MQFLSFPLLLISTVLFGCAQATAPLVQTIESTAAPAASSTTRAGTIEDTEPDVTRQVASFLEQIARNEVMRSAMTERASEAMDARAIATLAAQLQPCPRPLELALMDRRTKGEDRLYLYRAACGVRSLLVEIDFNKAARINRVNVRPEAP